MSGSNEVRKDQKPYDTGLFDPSVHDNQIVALYETEAKAQVARDKLVAAGVPSGAVQVMDRSADRMAGGVDYEAGDQGIWGAIKSLFMPDEDAHAYNRAVDQGHSMVVVTPTAETDRHQIIEVLESTDPIDFDAKLEEWRQIGYDYTGSTESAKNRNTAMRIPADYAVNQVTNTDRVPETGALRSSSGDDLRGPTVSGTIERGVERAGAAVTSAATAVSGALGLGGGDRAGNERVTTGPMTDRSSVSNTAGNDTIQIVEEQLRVGKREVPRGAVRVRSYVVERPAEAQVQLHEERVSVERRPMDRAATDADASLFADRTVEMQSRSEEAVVSRDVRVVEEISLRKEATDRVETVRDTVRRTGVEIDDGCGADTTGEKKP